jgi:hypothetical protein
LRWTPEVVNEVRQAFLEHPDASNDDFISTLKGQRTHSVEKA